MTRAPRPPADVLADLAALASRQAELTSELAAALRAASAPAPAPPRLAEPPAEYVTTAEAARLLGVSARTLESMRAQGRGPAHTRIGRAVRYPRAALSAVRTPSEVPPPSGVRADERK